MEISAHSLLVWFQVDVPAEWTNEQCWTLFDYADAQEAPALARLAVLRAFWQRLYGTKSA